MEQEHVLAADGGSRFRAAAIALGSLVLIILIGIWAIITFAPKNPEGWHRVAPGELVILGEVEVYNTAPFGSTADFEVNFNYRQGAQEIELSFRSRPKERMSFELVFDFEKFGFQPKFTNASLSVGENNHVSIATVEPKETPQTLTVLLTRH